MVGVTPLSSLRVSRHYIPQFNLTPNTSIQNPLLIYHACFPVDISIRDRITSSFARCEALCIAGRANLCFGGEDNPGRVVTEIKKGDVIIMPAGVAHRLLEDLGGGFLMVGSYPKGKSWTCVTEGKINKIKDLGWFTKDPIYGDEGPVLAH